MSTSSEPLAADPAVIATRLRPATPPARPLKVFMWSASEIDGTWTYRIKMPGDELNRLGHEVRMGTRLGEWARDEADIIVGQRVCMPGPSVLWQTICQHRRETGRGGMVYEVDDDLFNIDPKVNPMAPLFLRPDIRKNMIDNLKAADAVTVSTEPLARLIRTLRGRVRRDGGVHVLPNALREEVLTTAPARRDGPVILGWQGSATHAADWTVCRDAVADVLNADPFVHLRFLGVAHTEGLPLHRGQVEGLPWTTDIAAHYRRVAKFSLSLAPLEDTIFNRSKSGLRVQESLALGVPVVASNVEAYRPWVEPGRTGLLCEPNRDDWAAALRLLVASPTVRAEMGAAGREAARAWTIERTAPRWLDVYRSLLP